MEAAYNDSEGVTAEFNYNVIDRLADELGVALDRDKFSFRADWVEDEGAIVSRLWVDESHSVEMAGGAITFEAGEAIRMEESTQVHSERVRASCRAEWSRFGENLDRQRWRLCRGLLATTLSLTRLLRKSLSVWLGVVRRTCTFPL